MTFVQYYLPGYKSGGPVRTLANLVEQLGQEVDFRIVTTDRDMLEADPYKGVVTNQWTSVGKAQVYYAPEGSLNFGAIRALIAQTPHDVLYLNSFFNSRFTILPLCAWRLLRRRTGSVIVAPRGEFSEGALGLKRTKKRLFILASRLAGLYRDVIWQASSEHEERDIRKIYGDGARVYIAPNLSSMDPFGGTSAHARAREEGQPLRIVFLSRIARTKNLDFALQVISDVSQPVIFHIFGPIEDDAYWRDCRGLIERMPPHVSVSYHGPVKHDDVAEILSRYDLLFLPSRGENFGHVIAEALSVGTPVLISDATPWRHLENLGVGWDISLSSRDGFVSRLEAVAGLSCQELDSLRERVRSYARARRDDQTVLDANRRMFAENASRVPMKVAPKDAASIYGSGGHKS